MSLALASDMWLVLAASDVDEALAEIECQRELIVELMHLGQPTEAAEQALNSLLGQFASMIEHEHGILAEALEPKEWPGDKQRHNNVTDLFCLEGPER